MKARQLFLSSIALAAITILGSCKDEAPELPSVPSNPNGGGNGIESDFSNLTDKQKEELNNTVDVSKLLKPTEGYFVPNKTYPDNYASYAGWAQKDKWNLANVHDPSVVYYHGMYYMWGTDASYGNEHLKSSNGRHYPGKRSYDLVSWEYNPGPFNEPPKWALDTLNAVRQRMGLKADLKASDYNWLYWAPVVRVVNVDGVDVIRMYYAIGADNFIGSGGKPGTPFDGTWTERALIGMCETTNPSGGPSAWVDKGYVTSSASDKGLDYKRASENDWTAYYFYNAIDPTYIVTPDGKHYLIYGSWHSGFALMEIDPKTGKSVNMDPEKGLGEPYAENATELQERYGKRIATRGLSRWQASEAPEIIYHNGYYYLFMAWDPLDVAYNTRVVRASNIEGPYYTSRGANFTAGQEATKVYPIVTHPYKFKNGYGWVGIAHCCLFQNEVTKEWMYMSQQRFPANVGGNAFSNALMMGGVRKIVWCPATGEDLNDLWPIALPERYAAVEKENNTPLTEQDIFGEYEFIVLAYNIGKQDEAHKNNLVFKADHTYSLEGEADMQGTWEFDAEKKYIKLTSNTGKFVGSGNTLNTMILCAERELDWEKGNISVVFAGFHKNNTVTFWGKKVAELSK